MNKFTQISLIVVIFILACIIWLKPIPNRYTFRYNVADEYLGYTIYDTSTGKIYDYSNFIESGYEHIHIIDIVNNKQYSKDVTPIEFQFLKQQKEKVKVK